MRVYLEVSILMVLVSLASGGYFKRLLAPEMSDDNTVRSESQAKPTDTSRGALGQGFELHKIDLLSKQLQATGAKVFESLDPDSCTLTDAIGTTTRDDTFYKSTESIYSSLSTKTNLKGNMKSLYSLGGSVSGVTDNIVSGNTEVSGTSLNMKALSLATSLKQDCINKNSLAKELVEDFENLEKVINNPHKIRSWRSYKVFLEKYGSHIVKEVLSGACIYQYVFSKTSNKVTKKEYTAKACGSLGGKEKASDTGVNACADITKKDVEEASDKETVEKLVLRGGKAETRADLSGNISKEQINKFMKEGQTDPSPVEYEFYPIWTILKSRYIGKDDYCKAVNLEQFYKGYLNFDCSYTKTNEQELQRFELAEDSDPEAPTYVCKLAPEGCHSDDDCHMKNLLWCAVSGSTAIQYNETKLSSGSTKKEAIIFTGEEWEGPGCHKKMMKCKCTKPLKSWTESWSGENDNDKVLRDIHHKLSAKRRDEERREKSKNLARHIKEAKHL